MRKIVVGPAMVLAIAGGVALLNYMMRDMSPRDWSDKRIDAEISKLNMKAMEILKQQEKLLPEIEKESGNLERRRVVAADKLLELGKELDTVGREQLVLVQEELRRYESRITHQ